jgi:hypothetical protein
VSVSVGVAAVVGTSVVGASVVVSGVSCPAGWTPSTTTAVERSPAETVTVRLPAASTVRS